MDKFAIQFLICIVSIALSILFWFSTAFVMACYWDWFIVPAFDFQSLTMFQVFCVGFVASAANVQWFMRLDLPSTTLNIESENKAAQPIIINLAKLMIAWISWPVGWLVQFFVC